ncbi:Tol-pal system protein YbgF [Candidatus Filomicrobium marinum]|uniref:Cell division coordinator CpoB n=1 Tax=Candidatus Filomicrobium marinum TaxID=1608628 RepID=A0A0D6JA70_9HYPH|nr:MULTISPECIES: tol-pal system protein YbgF [Filomicrobium]CFX00175.1 Tol-pal system protein YbgF [Candidatus Filomicrobium marinum]CPR15183.1 Tol-pal system protein YbgF [Candidatus Filomicrobium marinum]
MVSTMLRYCRRAPFAIALVGGALAASFSSGAGAQQGDSVAALTKRVEQLEEQLVDMRVVIGTLESMSRSGGGTVPGAGMGGGLSGSDAARLDGMETQIRALTAQMEQLSRQMQSSGGFSTQAIAPPRGMGGAGSQPAVAANTSDSGLQDFGGFGSTTITSDVAPEDPIGGLLSQDANVSANTNPNVNGNHGGFGAQQVAAAPMGGGDPKQLYETAYGYLLQQDYGAAEASFEDFLNRYPSDPLSGNAQYWLGETHFVRSQYKAAASAFLKGYENYRQSSKAPDSLLKLAMSLDRLGQRDAACSSYSELTSQFPNAPQHIRERAAAERSRSGC